MLDTIIRLILAIDVLIVGAFFVYALVASIYVMSESID